MAAGLGTRLQPFTSRIAKPLLPLMGVPMAQYSLDMLARAGVENIVANVHHFPDDTIRGLSALDRGKARLQISDERSLLMGSAGGLKKALPLLGNRPFFLINADVLCDVDLESLAERHKFLRHYMGVRMTLMIYLKGPAGAKYSEIKLDQQRGLLRSLAEPASQRAFYLGVAIIEPDALAYVPENEPADFVPAILNHAIRSGRAGAFIVDNTDEEPLDRDWFDIGSPKLWQQTHISLIHKLETGRIPEIWKTRIEKNAKQLAPGMWTSKKVRIDAPPPEWSSPVWFDPDQDQSGIPAVAGPATVLYGAPNPHGLSDGIGWRGLWANLIGS